MLLDEPLSALDTPTRRRLRTELRQLLLDSAIPTLVVTHDRVEALALGDRVAVLVDGRLRQFGDVEDVFSHPADPEVAAAVDMETVTAGTVIDTHDGVTAVRVGSTKLFGVTALVKATAVHLIPRAIAPTPTQQEPQPHAELA